MHDSEATPNTDEDKADVLAKQKPAVQREEKFNPALYEQNKYLHTVREPGSQNSLKCIEQI